MTVGYYCWLVGAYADESIDVFNTEAHPLKAPTAKSVYGSGQILPSDTSAFKSISQHGPIISPAPVVAQSIPIPSATAA